MRLLALIGLISLTSINAHAGTPAIARSSSGNFVTEGAFEGGKEGTRANLESIRVADHPKEGFERWVIDFSDATTRTKGKTAPRFQVRYQKADRIKLAHGGSYVRKPAKFLVFFRSINKNNLTQQKVRSLVPQSLYVKDIVLYPPIEKGDMALEFVLRDDVKFEAHQPIEREGRLVLDLKNADEDADLPVG